MAEELSYDDAVLVLRGSLVEAAANARVFALRARRGGRLLTARDWAQLAEIEAGLEHDLADTLRLELHAEPWTWLARTGAIYRGAWLALQREPRLVRGMFESARNHPVDRWREAAPQLEASLWPFFADRTRYLANTLALALHEPAPFPALIWHPGRRAFRRTNGSAD